ncbi:MAG: bifunctional adenosylcobinamide kinase/adenosylcobinamide-phosphate guanylyltransferase [Nitrospirota bacterium]
MNNNRIILITGGARSGKSSFAIQRASACGSKKAYIATAEGLDEEMRQRIEAHRKQRGNDWRTFEEPLEIADLLKNIGRECGVIVLDCLTLWLSNVTTRSQNSGHRNQKSEVRSQRSELRARSSEQRTKSVETEIKRLLDSLRRFKDSPSDGSRRLFIVSNEVGMGIVPDNELSREFRDLAGFLNQKIADIADEVYFMVSGIPVKVKG